MFEHLSKEWKEFLGDEFLKETEARMSGFLDHVYREGVVYPAKENIFAALNLCPPKSVKVVILGQDPYHGEGEAQGLAFSVPNGVKCPPSLRNILTELAIDLGIKKPETTDLTPWAREGVLLLNTILTVEKDRAFSHKNKGWEEFTCGIVTKLSEQPLSIVFLLWGKPAEKFLPLIKSVKHLVLTAPHPSPLSAYRGFFGCKHFSKANSCLRSWGKGKIDWTL